MNKHFVALFIWLIGSAVIVNAQSFHNYGLSRDLIVSAATGTATYFGDLKDPKEYMDAKPNISLGAEYLFDKQFSARAEITWFRLSGDDSESALSGKNNRNLSFRSDNFEANVVGVFNLYPKGRRFYQRSEFNPYGFAGLGFLYFNPKGEVPATDWDGAPLAEAGKYIALQPIKTEGVAYSRMALVIPFGVGLKYKVNPFVDIALEAGYRLTFTDYLDDVSTVYLAHDSFGEDKLAQAMADKRNQIDLGPADTGGIRGYDDNNDGYFLMSLKVGYYLPTYNGPNKFRKNKRRPRGYRRR